MPKVRLLHKGKPVSVDIDANAAKLRTHEPFRFRLGYGVSVNTGVDTFFYSREQVDKLETDVLNEILHSEEPGSDIIVQNAEKRVETGAADITLLVQSVGYMTHPDVVMLVDMRSNAEKYVPSASAFAGQFRALARKVMDLTFYNCSIGDKAPARTKDFKDATKVVVRGLDQFEYDMPNHVPASPYVNFSVVPQGEQYSDVRFPTYYNASKQTKERIPKKRFNDVYLFYINELFQAYRRFLRMLKVQEMKPSSSVALVAPGPPADEDPDIDDLDLLGAEKGEKTVVASLPPPSPAPVVEERSSLSNLEEDLSRQLVDDLRSGRFNTIETASSRAKKSLNSSKYANLKNAKPGLVDELIDTHKGEFKAKNEVKSKKTKLDLPDEPPESFT